MLIEPQKDHFLNQDQKELKQKIMEELLEALFGNLKKNQDLLNEQATADIIMSCLVMFNRDVLFHFIKASGIDAAKKEDDFMSYFFKTVNEETLIALKA